MSAETPEVALRTAAVELARLGPARDSRDSAGQKANRKLLRAAVRYAETRYRLTKPLKALPKRCGLHRMELNGRDTLWWVDKIDVKRGRVHIEGRGWHSVAKGWPS